MIEQILHFIKDPAKVARIAIIGFFLAVLFTTYFLFTLPNDLVYKGGMIDSGRATSVYAKLFVMVGLAFAFCYTAIRYIQISKRETIVFRDKENEDSSTSNSGSSQGHGSFNINSLREAINKAKTKEEKWQQGLNQLCHSLNAGQGAIYILAAKGDRKYLDLKSGFALVLAEGEKTPTFEIGEGLVGQVAASGKSLYLDEMPEGYAARIESGLGASLPKSLFILPLKKENEVTGVVEVALFGELSEADRKQALDASSILADIS